MILVTGAGGKTGRAIVDALTGQGETVRVWVRRPEQANGLPCADWIAGDMQDAPIWEAACQRVRAVYHICPNLHPAEVAISHVAVEAASRAGVARFVYHSVLHPQTSTMAHHWRKLESEEVILASGLPFTILQPCAYMQNVLAHWPSITQRGVYPVPYALDARLSLVDLRDVAGVAAKVLTESGHTGAIYELAGPQPLSQTEVAELLAESLGRPVRAERVAWAQWEADARQRGMGEEAIATLLAMFRYYDRHGLVGNPNVLGWLLGRPPTSFADFASSQ
ncbi:MAG: NmrA family NAD(P)-binding protein [Caldilineaceae bacterium]|nr:NmrA family NAD(P)-binding protein [Caldilineaceae bacterium]HRJ43921.1 NmrA family NAD(P)-binding protein [Caldilineaceae bacterium]